ncbi:MAG TPA: hypothetical protein VN944_09225 [Nitrospiria bacterium]|nr:hypothetical protein [Nitrospiria bacterium]
MTGKKAFAGAGFFLAADLLTGFNADFFFLAAVAACFLATGRFAVFPGLAFRLFFAGAAFFTDFAATLFFLMVEVIFFLAAGFFVTFFEDFDLAFITISSWCFGNYDISGIESA